MQESPFILEVTSPAGRLSTPLHAKDREKVRDIVRVMRGEKLTRLEI